MKLTTFVTYLYDVIVLIVAVIGIIQYKKLNTPFKILTFCAICTFFTTVMSGIYVAFNGTNAPVLHVEALIEYIFYAFIYYCFFTNRKIKTAITVSIIIISVFSIINALTLQPFLTDFPTNINLSTLAILTILSLLLFRQMLLSPLKTPLLEQGVFWYNTAILFSSTTLFITYGLANYFLRLSFFNYLFYLWYTILYIFAVLIILALLKDSQEHSKNHAI